MLLYFSNRARLALVGVFYEDDCICVLIKFGNSNETINSSFLWLGRYEFRGHSEKKEKTTEEKLNEI